MALLEKVKGSPSCAGLALTLMHMLDHQIDIISK